MRALAQSPTLLPEYCTGQYTPSGLLHGHALGEVAGLIDIAAAQDGDVVGEKLKWDGGQDRVNRFDGLGNIEHVVGYLGNLFVAFRGQRDDGTL